MRQGHWRAQGRLKRERPARESHVRHVDAPFKATDTDVVLCRHAEHHFEGAPSEHVGRDVLADAALRRFTETFHLLLERELQLLNAPQLLDGAVAQALDAAARDLRQRAHQPRAQPALEQLFLDVVQA